MYHKIQFQDSFFQSFVKLLLRILTQMFGRHSLQYVLHHRLTNSNCLWKKFLLTLIWQSPARTYVEIMGTANPHKFHLVDMIPFVFFLQIWWPWMYHKLSHLIFISMILIHFSGWSSHRQHYPKQSVGHRASLAIVVCGWANAANHCELVDAHFSKICLKTFSPFSKQCNLLITSNQDWI